MGEFDRFLSNGMHSSSVGHEIQLWGTRDYSDVEVKGNSIKSNYPRYASEEKAREWLSFDVDYISASEAANRLQSL